MQQKRRSGDEGRGRGGSDRHLVDEDSRREAQDSEATARKGEVYLKVNPVGKGIVYDRWISLFQHQELAHRCGAALSLVPISTLAGAVSCLLTQA